MGAITQDKHNYDGLTVDIFRRKGWKAFSVAKAGRYADVIAVKGSSLAVIEVKSPNETSAVKSYDDSTNLSPELDRKIGRYLKETRVKVFDLFGRGKSIQQLYAVSVASQLYRYIYEFDEKAAEYEKAINSAVKLTNIRFTKTPFLVVPALYSKEAQEAMSVLKSNRYINTFRSWTNSPLFIIEASLR